jgi:hypothetical protein
MDAIEVVKEMVQFFWSVRPDHKCVDITEPAHRLVGSPAEQQLLKILQVGKYR